MDNYDDVKLLADVIEAYLPKFYVVVDGDDKTLFIEHGKAF